MSPDMLETFKPVLIGAVILFVIGYLGNVIAFGGRFVNALVTAILFAIVYGVVFYLAGQSGIATPISSMSIEEQVKIIGVAAAVVFVIDLIANMLSFSSRFMNALMTAIVFLVVYGVMLYATGGIPAGTAT